MNPYKILNIVPDADPKEIVQAALKAMQERTHGSQEIAMAQKLLLNPATRPLQYFMNVLDFKSMKEAQGLKRPISPNTAQEKTFPLGTIHQPPEE